MSSYEKSADSLPLHSDRPSALSIHPKLVCEKRASIMYGMSVHWFRKKRISGDGPRFQKIGRAIRYRVSDLDEYFDPANH
jgi:hypothetical protein